MKPPARQPIITLLLIGANILGAYWLALSPGVIDSAGFWAAQPTFMGALLCLFLHQNLFHLLGNMLFLAAVGPAVESAAGMGRFVFVYLFGGMLGVLVHWLFTRQNVSAPPLIGASASAAACIAYYNLRYVRMQVILAPRRGVSILVVTSLWFVLQVMGGLVKMGDGAGTAYWAHIGGFAAGLLTALMFRAPKEEDQHLGHALISKMDERSPAARLAASELHLAEYPNDLQALFHKAEAMSNMDDFEGESQVLLELYKKVPASDKAPILGRVARLGHLNQIASNERMNQAERLREASPDLAQTLLLSVVAEPKDSQRPDALLALAGLCPEEEASGWLKELSEHYPLHPATQVARSRGLL